MTITADTADTTPSLPATAPVGLREHPVWAALDTMETRPHGGLDLDEMRQIMIAGWDRGVTPFRALHDSGMSWDQLSIFVWASTQDLEVVDLSAYYIDINTLSGYPLDMAAHFHVLPIQRSSDGSQMVVAVSNLNDMDALRSIGTRFKNSNVHLVLADPLDIESVVEQLRAEVGMSSMVKMAEDIDNQVNTEIIDDDDDSDSDAQIVQLARNIVEQALNNRASDIHIDPTDKHSVVKYRIDGRLQVVTRNSLQLHAPITNYIKTRSHLDIANQRSPQDGGYIIRTTDGQQLHLRVATVPTNNRLADVPLEKITIRLVATEESLTDLRDLGMNPDTLDRMMQLFRLNSGMVVISGPTGSGKTTTMYGAIRAIADDSRNIMTVEDPIERRLTGVNQVQVNTKAGIGYPEALRAFLRHDPDVLLVGEIRADTETVKTAMEAAMTGRLVLSSTHTSSSAEVPTRFLLMGMESFMVSSALRGVISQRLARVLCHKCKQAVDTPEIIDAVPWPEGYKPDVIYKASGCSLCKGTGYRGRVAVAEVMIIDNELEDLIIQRVTTREIQDCAIKNGMRTLSEDVLVKVAQGVTSLDEWTVLKN